MRNSITTPCVLFPDLFNRPLRATFEVPNASSEGGAVLLKAADRRLGLIPRLAAALVVSTGNQISSPAGTERARQRQRYPQ